MRKKKKEKKLKAPWMETYTKKIVTIITFNAIGWVWASYILAYLGRYEIAEELARSVVTAIIAVVLTYSLKSLMENVSKHGYKGKLPKDEEVTAEKEIAENVDSYESKGYEDRI